MLYFSYATLFRRRPRQVSQCCSVVSQSVQGSPKGLLLSCMVTRNPSFFHKSSFCFLSDIIPSHYICKALHLLLGLLNDNFKYLERRGTQTFITQISQMKWHCEINDQALKTQTHTHTLHTSGYFSIWGVPPILHLHLTPSLKVVLKKFKLSL